MCYEKSNGKIFHTRKIFTKPLKIHDNNKRCLKCNKDGKDKYLSRSLFQCEIQVSCDHEFVDCALAKQEEVALHCKKNELLEKTEKSMIN